ncbi:MAG: FAD-dependent oxidoreductase [Candidatus Competibacterales bacterium]|nr:FAD-dependent oxidoreductase [Candidatus Competibacterales bacterium]
MTRNADVCIIGGGIHGCSAALHLALADRRVILLERDHVGRHASGVNAGGVRRLGRDFAELPLAQASMRLWHRIEELVHDDCGFVASGQVKVAENETELARLRHRVEQVRALGHDHEELIDADELRHWIPALAPHCVGALVVRDDGHANPFRTVQAFRRRAIALGARFHEGVAVTGLRRVGRVWRISTGAGTFEAATVVNCAGAWGAEIAGWVGEPVPLRAEAPMLMVSERLRPFLSPVVGAAGRTLSFKQQANGTLIIGGGHRGEADPGRGRTRLDWSRLAINARTVTALFPQLRDLRLVRAWAGIEGVLPDGLPVYGPGRNEEGLIHAFGFSAHGFQLGPASGRVIAELVTQGRSAIPLDGLGIGRFS